MRWKIRYDRYVRYDGYLGYDGYLWYGRQLSRSDKKLRDDAGESAWIAEHVFAAARDEVPADRGAKDGTQAQQNPERRLQHRDAKDDGDEREAADAVDAGRIETDVEHPVSFRHVVVKRRLPGGIFHQLQGTD